MGTCSPRDRTRTSETRVEPPNTEARSDLCLEVGSSWLVDVQEVPEPPISLRLGGAPTWREEWLTCVHIPAPINEAISDLWERPDDELRTRANAWLLEAQAALVDRNGVVHSIPETSIPLPGVELSDGLPASRLTHFPKDRSRPTVHTPLPVPGLRRVRQRLEAARSGWVELVCPLWSTRPRPRGDDADTCARQDPW